MVQGGLKGGEMKINIVYPYNSLTAHTWKIGGKEIRGFLVDTCLKCGTLQLLCDEAFYVKPQEATKFLTTTKPVEFHRYFRWEGSVNK